MADERTPKGILSLFLNTKKKSDKSPAYSGNGRITRSAIVELNNQFKELGQFDNDAGEEVLELSCAGWVKSPRGGGNDYVFLIFGAKEEYEGGGDKAGSGDPLDLTGGKAPDDDLQI